MRVGRRGLVDRPAARDSRLIKFAIKLEFKMAHGGPRPGAGRKPRDPNLPRPPRAVPVETVVRERIASGNRMPLDVMLEAMTQFLDAGDLKEAAKIAALAAPYLHPKMAPADVKTINGTARPVQALDKHELLDIAASGRA